MWIKASVVVLGAVFDDESEQVMQVPTKPPLTIHCDSLVSSVQDVSDRVCVRKLFFDVGFSVMRRICAGCTTVIDPYLSQIVRHHHVPIKVVPFCIDHHSVHAAVVLW